MTYNIRSALNHPERLAALAEVIERVDPDVLALQEVDRDTVRSDHTDQTAWLAAQLGLPHHEFIPATPWEGGGEYGIALLSRFKLNGSSTRQLYVETGPDVPHSATEPRALAAARINVGGREVHVFNTHLGLTGKQRSKQLQEIAAVIASVPAGTPTVLLGDLNASPEDPELAPVQALLADALQDVPIAERGTCPQGVPLAEAAAIDYILFSAASLRVLDAFVLPDGTGASDHNPVVARFAFRFPDK